MSSFQGSNPCASADRGDASESSCWPSSRLEFVGQRAPVAQWIRASGYGPEGRGVESLRAYAASSWSVDTPVTLSELISERHHRHVLSRAQSHLAPGETVISWARARHPRRGHGFVYLTSDRLLVVWSSPSDGHRAVALKEIEAWGIDAGARGGPLLCVESSETAVLVHMPVRNGASETRASSFVHRLGRAAARPRRRVRVDGHPGAFESDPNRVAFTRQRLSPAELTKRVIITVIGVLLMFTGAVITPIPGPWSLPILLGGLALLASEYDWARDVLDWVKEKSRRARDRLRARRAER
jgi:hypothetical protein